AHRRFKHRAYGAAELRQEFRDQHRCDAEHETGEQGGFKNNHAGANHDDRCRGCDQLVVALGWIAEAVSCLNRMVVSHFAASRAIGLVRLHGIPPFRARPMRSDNIEVMQSRLRTSPTPTIMMVPNCDELNKLTGQVRSAPTGANPARPDPPTNLDF